MIFVDTSFIIAWLNTRDQLHHKALEMRDKYLSEIWLTTDCILLEVGNAFARHYRAKAIEVIENILTDEKATVVAGSTPICLIGHLSCINNVATRRGGSSTAFRS